jgi:hypothetical protein
MSWMDRALVNEKRYGGFVIELIGVSRNVKLRVFLSDQHKDWEPAGEFWAQLLCPLYRGERLKICFETYPILGLSRSTIARRTTDAPWLSIQYGYLGSTRRLFLLVYSPNIKARGQKLLWSVKDMHKSRVHDYFRSFDRSNIFLIKFNSLLCLARRWYDRPSISSIAPVLFITVSNTQICQLCQILHAFTLAIRHIFIAFKFKISQKSMNSWASLIFKFKFN